MSKGQTLQEPFLNTLRKERIPVSIFRIVLGAMDTIRVLVTVF